MPPAISSSFSARTPVWRRPLSRLGTRPASGASFLPYSVFALDGVSALPLAEPAPHLHKHTHVTGEGELAAHEGSRAVQLAAADLQPDVGRGVDGHGGAVGLTLFDVLGTLATLAMGGMLLRRVLRNLRILGQLEPPNVVQDRDE